MKKKVVACLLAGTMAMSLTACGGGGVSSNSSTGKEDSREQRRFRSWCRTDSGTTGTTGRRAGRRAVCRSDHTGIFITGYDEWMVG